MSRICFIIIAHKNYNQTMRLINHLKTDFDLYVHIDKKSKLNIKSFDNVYIYKKYSVYYGGFSQITTTLYLMKEAFKNNYDRYIFISAQDIPLKTNKEINEFFKNKINKEFISYQDVETDENMYKEMCHRFNTYNLGPLYRKCLHAKVRAFISNIPFLKREMPKNIYYGSSWWNLTNNAIKYILEYIEKNPNFIKRFNYTWCGDEMFFQSILLNSEFKNDCINDNLRYIDWSEKKGSSPKTFNINDYNIIKENINNNLFARKFDENFDNDIINKLYKDLEVK
ncbi:beta-1,6-N-acetylglucosaminyltransferase [Brachyspira pilosicoli]|uniref:beta-1,6-N-acetylglucosaminyltransferase n=1 Tax=Brachyspira pilosicoli TaxID=52584 RepID=UPI0024309140|nr:beta-1,6-N-acetylglucosaminyltransferase [Brachyspira pilosicoli]